MEPIQNTTAIPASKAIERKSLARFPKSERRGIFLSRSPNATHPTMANSSALVAAYV
jgi:hypothetical protein